MKPINLKYQNGLALIMFVLMLMGVGGLLLVGYSQGILKQVEVNKFKHNVRILKEAKQALLQFAYNYPVTNGNGPGRLPCADIDNDGDANTAFGDCITLGRLPWNEQNLNLYDIRDADGQRLWYAVSDAFATNVGGGNIINSDATGTITVRDQAGNVIYDGSANGVAAVIIAPGAITSRNGVPQDRSIIDDDPFDTVADDDPGVILASNYLDLVVGTEDNADFTQDSAADGFILGPVDSKSINAVNDQMIIITAAEVIEVAEKATSQAYRNVIDNYHQTLWGGTVANYRYPWMNAYANIADLNIYDVVPGTTVGRIPYINYYTDHDSHVVITDLVIDYDFDWNLTDTADGNDSTYIDAFSAFFGGPQTLDITRSNLSFEKKNFDGSVNNTTDNIGTLITRIDGSTVVNSSNSTTPDVTLYFWDGTGAPLPENGWELCPVNSGDETDCARNLAGTAFVPFNPIPAPGWVNHVDMKIRKVKLQWTLDAEFKIEFDYSILPSFAYTAPTVAANARFTTTHNPASVTDREIDIDSSVNDDIDFIDVTVTFCEQDNDVGNEFNIPSSNPNGGSATCAPTLDTAVVVNQFDITADYYPELPLWVSQNNWNDSIMMSYADLYQPGGAGTCTPEDGDPSTGAPDDCIVVQNLAGTNNDIVSLLVMAGELDFIDGDDLNNDGDFLDADEDPPDNDFSNDLHDIFETENYSQIGPYPSPNNDPDPASDTGLRLVFDNREDTVDGNASDILFIIN